MKLSGRFFKWITISPLYILVGIIGLLPSLYAIFLSFTNQNLFGGKWDFVGFTNFVKIFHNPEFWLALKNNVVYGFSCTFFQVVLGLGISLLLVRTFKGNFTLRGIIIFPYLVPTIVAVLTFDWMFHDLHGVVNHFLMSLGFGRIAWLGPAMAMFTVVLVSVWRFLPFTVLLLLPALQAIPGELYEAAKIDGASAFQQFTHITIPKLKPVLFIVALLRGIWMFNNFNIIWLMTQGGPVQKTLHIPVLSYTEAFSRFNIARGSATAVAGLSLLLIFIILYFRSTSE